MRLALLLTLAALLSAAVWACARRGAERVRRVLCGRDEREEMERFAEDVRRTVRDSQDVLRELE